MRRVAVIDYGMGNLRSVSKALESVAHNVAVDVTADPTTILAASHVVFPGVG
ncbi:MAG: imidazole glycerol phosphate synthase subunit HisH, partial [Tenericutes bacterium]